METEANKPTIWSSRGEYFWSTIAPHPADPDPSVPAGPFESFQEARDDVTDFFNSETVALLAVVPDRFQTQTN